MEDWNNQFHSILVGNDNFIVHRRYIDLKPIGAGANGFVCSATDQVSGQKVAIKRIADVLREPTEAKRVLREIKLLKAFTQHPNIITLLDVFTVPVNTIEFKDVYIVTILMESDLDRIVSSNQELQDQHFKYFLYQMLKGLKHLHAGNVLHRDIKTSNLLVNANCDLRVCDFGLARGVEGDAEQEGLTEYVVTRWYRAPELLLNCGAYGKAVDVWSVGCVLAELACRRPFFPGKNPLQQLKMILTALGVPPDEDLAFLDSTTRAEILRFKAARPPPEPLATYFPPGTDPLCLDLVARMLVFNPERRISVDEALNHPYLEQFRGMFEEGDTPAPFDFSFDRPIPPVVTAEQLQIIQAEIKLLLYREVLELHAFDASAVPRYEQLLAHHLPAAAFPNQPQPHGGGGFHDPAAPAGYAPFDPAAAAAAALPAGGGQGFYPLQQPQQQHLRRPPQRPPGGDGAGAAGGGGGGDGMDEEDDDDDAFFDAREQEG